MAPEIYFYSFKTAFITKKYYELERFSQNPISTSIKMKKLFVQHLYLGKADEKGCKAS
jgi:hypothetical protein